MLYKLDIEGYTSPYKQRPSFKKEYMIDNNCQQERVTDMHISNIWQLNVTDTNPDFNG